MFYGVNTKDGSIPILAPGLQEYPDNLPADVRPIPYIAPLRKNWDKRIPFHNYIIGKEERKA